MVEFVANVVGFEMRMGNVLSLFDGMSCGQIALKKLGVEHEGYYASEIDKYAIQVSKDNFPGMVHLGDVTKINGVDLPKIDLLIGGSPCQGFSFAGKQLNFNDHRSKLFFEFVRIKNEINPKWFMLENVFMKKEYQDVITDQLGVEPVRINSNNYTEMNRDRLFWTNIPITLNCVKRKPSVVLLDDECFATVGTSRNRVIVERSNVMALTATMYKGLCAAGRPMIAKKEALGMNFFEAKHLIRMLTVDECRKLQGIPDEYIMSVSKTQALKMLGNGWTIDVVMDIFKGVE